VDIISPWQIQVLIPSLSKETLGLQRASKDFIDQLSPCQCRKRVVEILKKGGLGDYFLHGGAGASSFDIFSHHCYVYLNLHMEPAMPMSFEPLVPHLALLRSYETNPVWSLGRLMEAYLVTRQPRADRAIYGASHISSQAAASTSNQPQLAKNNPKRISGPPNHQW